MNIKERFAKNFENKEIHHSLRTLNTEAYNIVALDNIHDKYIGERFYPCISDTQGRRYAVLTTKHDEKRYFELLDVVMNLNKEK